MSLYVLKWLHLTEVTVLKYLPLTEVQTNQTIMIIKLGKFHVMAIKTTDLLWI